MPTIKPVVGLVLGVVALTIACLAAVFGFLAYFQKKETMQNLYFVTGATGATGGTGAVSSGGGSYVVDFHGEDQPMASGLTGNPGGRYTNHVLTIPAGTMTKHGDMIEFGFTFTSINASVTLNTGGTFSIGPHVHNTNGSDGAQILGHLILDATNSKAVLHYAARDNFLGPTGGEGNGGSGNSAFFDGSGAVEIYVYKDDLPSAGNATCMLSYAIFHPAQ